MTGTLDQRFAITRDWVERSLEREPFLRGMGVQIRALAPGRAELGLPRRDDLLQGNGFFHGGVVSALFDACISMAAATTMQSLEHELILTAEFKINILSPALGPVLIARAEVLKPGRRLVVVQGKLFNAGGDAPEKLVAAGLGTTMRGQRVPGA